MATRKRAKTSRRAAATKTAATKRPWSQSFKFALTPEQRKKLAKLGGSAFYLRVKVQQGKLVVAAVGKRPAREHFVPSNSAFAE
jgi:hypothetical protein